MTVRAIVPIIEYTGNGTTTRYAWDWDMIEDSNINVLVNNIFVFNWVLEGQTVVFTIAPEEGDDIRIYRITTLWMPENYRPFGRFHSEKTELSVDRAIMICQERGGRRGGNAGEGIVGGADLHILRGEFDVTVVSERGTDAVLLMYDYDDVAPPTPGSPDPTIAIWEGDPIVGGQYVLSGVNGAAATIRFRMDLVTGDPTKASSYWPNFNAFEYTSWCTVDPSDQEYWMRVTAAGDIPPSSRYQIYDPWNGNIALGTAFPIRSAPVVPFDVLVDRYGNIITDSELFYVFPRGAEDYEQGIQGPFVSVFTFGDPPFTTRIGTFNIEICKDNGSGLPDDNWASRIVTLEAIS